MAPDPLAVTLEKRQPSARFDAFARRLSRDSSQSVGLSGGGYDINLVGVEIRLHP